MQARNSDDRRADWGEPPSLDQPEPHRRYRWPPREYPGHAGRAPNSKDRAGTTWQPSLMTEIRLQPGTSLKDLAQTLEKQADDAEYIILWHTSEPELRFVNHPGRWLSLYFTWVTIAANMLANHLQRAQLEQLLHTRHYWAFRQTNGDQQWLPRQVRDELYARRQAIRALAAEAEALADHWRVPGVIVVPDTNMLLHTTDLFDELDWLTALDIDDSVHLVIPMVVVDQLDSLKRNKQIPIRSRARQTGKRLEVLLSTSDRAVLSQPNPDTGGPVTTVEVLVDPLDHTRLEDSDSEIVDRARYLNDVTSKTVLIATWDNIMRFRAKAAGIKTVTPAPEYEQAD